MAPEEAEEAFALIGSRRSNDMHYTVRIGDGINCRSFRSFFFYFFLFLPISIFCCWFSHLLSFIAHFPTLALFLREIGPFSFSFAFVRMSPFIIISSFLAKME